MRSEAVRLSEAWGWGYGGLPPLAGYRLLTSEKMGVG